MPAIHVEIIVNGLPHQPVSDSDSLCGEYSQGSGASDYDGDKRGFYDLGSASLRYT
jgi:hypothetical protein